MFEPLSASCAGTSQTGKRPGGYGTNRTPLFDKRNSFFQAGVEVVFCVLLIFGKEVSANRQQKVVILDS